MPEVLWIRRNSGNGREMQDDPGIAILQRQGRSLFHTAPERPCLRAIQQGAPPASHPRSPSQFPAALML